MQSMRKKGRPAAFHRMADGTKIDGLSRMSDGRWKVSPFPGQQKAIKFAEEDERLAVARFHALRSRKVTVSIPLVDAKPHEFDHIPPTGWEPPRTEVNENAMWAWFREQLLTRPKYVALKTGVEQLGWMTDMVRPEASPTLKEVGEEYYDRKSDLSEKEANKCKSTWSHFMRATGVPTLRELTAELVAKWGTKIKAEGLAAKTVAH
ncbi:MAG TPA: hypothetical protein VGB55_08350, partial [Tepidisphaeraceae bacterium]